MITIKNIKLSELYEIVELLKKEHGEFKVSYDEMNHIEYCDYEDSLVVMTYVDTIINDID